MDKKKPVAKAKKTAAKKAPVTKKEVIVPVIEPKMVVVKEEKVDVEALMKEQALKISQQKAEVRLKANKQSVIRPH